MQLDFLLISIVKIVAIIAYLYGLLKFMGHPKLWVKIVGVVGSFAIIQLALTPLFGMDAILSSFDSGLLFQSISMAMVALGLNLIYGFNGQFSLGQFGFYGIGAYCSADITYRWVNGDARGLLVVGIGTTLGALMIWLVGKWLRNYRRVPVLSSFTIYLVGSLIAGVIAVAIANFLNPFISPLLGTVSAPGVLATGIPLQIVFFMAVVFAGIFAAEISFLFGLPVLSLGSDYFGIATLGFVIVVNTLMVNSDTILPFPEMKGGRGMLGIPQLTTWFWAFFFLIVVIIIMRNVIHSSTGRAILSVREDETAAKAMGIDIAGTKLLTFVIGSLFAGLAGGVYAHFIGFLSPGTFSFLVSFNPLIIVVFGGLGSMSGTIAASFGWIFFLEGLLRVILKSIGNRRPYLALCTLPDDFASVNAGAPTGLIGVGRMGVLKGERGSYPSHS